MTITTYVKLNNIKHISNIKIINDINVGSINKEFKTSLNITYKFEFSNQYSNDPNYMSIQISTELYTKLLMLNIIV